ncbi:MAG: hypothetical protein IM568_01900 [Flavobacterium sp.]|nr:hypothetical protein [Flavobacterium sp.]
MKNLEVNISVYTCFLFILFLNSCKSKQDLIKDKLIGSWDIYEMSYKDKDYLETLLINAFTIEKDSAVTIPDTIHSEIEDSEIISKWSIKQVEKNRSILFIDCKKNPAFTGNYKIRFFKNYERKLLGIELKSETTYISAYKVLQNFDIDGKNWDVP